MSGKVHKRLRKFAVTMGEKGKINRNAKREYNRLSTKERGLLNSEMSEHNSKFK